MSRGRLAIWSLTVLIIGIGAVLLIGGVEAMLLGSDPAFRTASGTWLPEVRAMLQERYPALLTAELVGLLTCVVGASGLLIRGGWYVADRLVAGGQRVGNRQLAQRVERLLADGARRDAVEQRLIGEGLASADVEAALELEWPRAVTCSQCGAEARRLAFLERYLRRSWYVCSTCSSVEPAKASPSPRPSA